MIHFDPSTYAAAVHPGKPDRWEFRRDAAAAWAKYASCVVPWWYNDYSPRDLITRRRANADTEGSRATGNKGPGYLSASAKANTVFNYSSSWDLDGDRNFTLLFVLRIDGTSGSGCAFFSRRSVGSGGVDPGYMTFSGTGSPGDPKFEWKDSGGTIRSVSWSGAWPANGFHTIAICRRAGGEYELFVDGVSQGTQSQASTYPASAAHALEIGSVLKAFGSTARSVHGLYYLFAQLTGYAFTATDARDFHVDPFALIRPDITQFVWPKAPAGGAADTVTAGLATETDTALATDIVEGVAAGLPTETDTALAPTLAEVMVMGLATEADSALALSIDEGVTGGLATETDTALPVDAADVVTAGLPTETDSALTLAIDEGVNLGVALEEDSALGLESDTLPGAASADPLSRIRAIVNDEHVSLDLVAANMGGVVVITATAVAASTDAIYTNAVLMQAEEDCFIEAGVDPDDATTASVKLQAGEIYQTGWVPGWKLNVRRVSATGNVYVIPGM